jgi:hypothetical protein
LAERESTGPKLERRPMRKIGIVLYALFMAFVHSHYITAQLYPNSEYFFGLWYGVSDAQLMTGEALAIFTNIGLLLSPFLAAPRLAMRLLMVTSLVAGAIVATVHLAHMFSIHAFFPFWPQELDPNLPQGEAFDHIYIRMFIDHLIIYAIDLFAIYLYLSRLRHLHVFRQRKL